MRLLKNGMVQLHMPRTGGKSLAKQYGVAKLEGSLHDGPFQIPEKWKHFKTITTFREREPWEESMERYLGRIGKFRQALNFRINTPKDCLIDLELDPTFGLWPDPECYLRSFIIENSWFSTWYDLYLAYYVYPADKIINIDSLEIEDLR